MSPTSARFGRIGEHSIARRGTPRRRNVFSSTARRSSPNLNGGEKTSAVAEHVVDALVKQGRNPAVVSTVTVMEVLVRPRRRSLAHYDHALDFLGNFPNLDAQRIDLAIVQVRQRFARCTTSRRRTLSS
jgi:hypothetical protein